MTSTNLHYTFNYSQPEEYRFSHDSVFLAREVFERIKTRKNLTALDVCAGCGIVGLDLLFHLNKDGAGEAIARFDFLEVQDTYREHFQKNVERSGLGPSQTQFLLGNYMDLKTPYYDVIVSNPPYFRRGQGKLSPSEFKNRCRFFIDADFESLLLSFARALKPDGEAYFLLRDLEDHGFEAQKEAAAILNDYGQLSRLGDIRGTGFMLFKRNP